MSEIVPVKLSLGELNTITEGDTLWIVFRPAIDALGLNVKTQMDKVKSRSWACVSLRDMQLPGDTQVRRHLVVDRKTLTMWLATVNEHNVAHEKRPQLVAYQMEATEALDRYFHEGVAENPRAVAAEPVAALPAPVVADPDTYPLVDVIVLMRQRFGVRVHLTDLTRILRAGSVLRQDGRPSADYGHLFWLKKNGSYEVFEHTIAPLYHLYESTKLRLEMAAQRALPMDPPGWPELPFEGGA